MYVSPVCLRRFKSSVKYPGTHQKRPSDPVVLARVGNFTKRWFQQMEHQISRLGLLVPPRTRGEFKLLVSYPGCEPQKLHWDFNPDTVTKLIGEKKYHGVPVSVIGSFTPTGSQLTIQVGHTHTVTHMYHFHVPPHTHPPTPYRTKRPEN